MWLGPGPSEAGRSSRMALSLGLVMGLGQLILHLPSLRAVVRIRSVNVSEMFTSVRPHHCYRYEEQQSRDVVFGTLNDHLTVSRTTGEAELKSCNHGARVNSLSSSTQAQVVMKRLFSSNFVYWGR